MPIASGMGLVEAAQSGGSTILLTCSLTDAVTAAKTPMLSYIHLIDAPKPDRSEGLPQRSAQEKTQAELKRQSTRALTKQFHQLQSNYSLERHLFW